jgi:hypothetical protein
VALIQLSGAGHQLGRFHAVTGEEQEVMDIRGTGGNKNKNGGSETQKIRE